MASDQHLVIPVNLEAPELTFKVLLWPVAIFIFCYPLWVVYKRWRVKYNMLLNVPASNANQLLLFCAVLNAVFSNKRVDSNVLFFQFVCGVIRMFENKRIFRFWLGPRPIIICFKPETFEAILRSSVNIQKSFDYNFLRLWLKDGLVTSTGSKWKTRRKLLTPAFHFRILEEFVPVFDEQSRILVDQLKKRPHQDPLDVVPYVTLCTLDMICETAMGIKLNAQQNQESVYLKSMHSVCQGFIVRLLRPWLWNDILYFMTGRGKNFKKNTDAMDRFTRKVIRERKAELLGKGIGLNGNTVLSYKDSKRQAFLDLLLHHHFADPSLTEQDIQEEVDSFMFAGHDTTAVGLSWALYVLGLYPEIQKKAREEVDEIFGDDLERPILADDLKELKYMECVLKETQRLYPSAPFFARDLVEDVEFDKYTLPKGTTCMMFTYMLHRNAEVFQNPEVFDPDRFLPENCVGRHPYAYVPFSAGPRSCIGQKFAMLEEKTVLANVLRNFEIEAVDERDKLHIVAEMVLRSKQGVRLRLKERWNKTQVTQFPQNV